MLDNDWPTLDVLRFRYIGLVLDHTGGNKTRAADLLGIDRRTLNRILARERARQAAAARARRLSNGVVMNGAAVNGAAMNGHHHPVANGAAPRPAVPVAAQMRG